jgi:hypothetical protein
MMDTWFSKQIGDGIMAPMPSAQIEEIFLPLFETAGKPVNMALFTRYESEGRLHCEVTAYFSPAAADVAKALDAEPCERPSRTELGLLMGDKLAWSVLFPGGE